ncbi:hypothetical protein A9977_07875 [Variovorax sp. UMC13]|nr:hypothetical protein [Variovorax sp. UMC13]
MRATLTSFNNGDISAALSQLKHRGWTSSTTLAKALRQLEAGGFLRVTRKTVGVEKGSKVCNLYRFTDIEVFEQPKKHIPAVKATRDWEGFATLTEAERAIAEASVPEPMSPEKLAARKKRTLQKLHRDDAETAAMARFDAAETAVRGGGVTAETAPITGPPKGQISKSGNYLEHV